jgi:hypothetical protein
MDKFYLIFTLLAVYQMKHFLSDFPLQRPYMLRKFMGGTAWILPLAAHAGVHAAFTLAITLVVRPALWWLCLLDFTVHFIVDRIKAAPTWGGRWKPEQPYFWWALGADQMMHHLTHYLIIWNLVS